MFFDPYYLIFIIPAMLFSIYAQYRVVSSFELYAARFSKGGLTGYQVARILLDKNGLSNVAITRVKGELTDHFDPRTNSIGLCDRVFDSTSIASIGIAAHEVGHAIQYANDYTPMIVRGVILPITNVATKFAFPLGLLGIVLGYGWLITIGIAIFMVVVVFQIFTLPIEYNASAKALQTLQDYNILESDELESATKVLSAAALTYVAALMVAIMHLVRLLLLRGKK